MVSSSFLISCQYAKTQNLLLFLEEDNLQTHSHSLSHTPPPLKRNKKGAVLFLEGANRKSEGGLGCEIVNVSDVFSLHNLIPDNGTSYSVCQCLFTHK